MNFIEYLNNKNYEYPKQTQTGDSHEVYSCPLGHYLINLKHKRLTLSIDVAVVLSEDNEIRKKFAQLFRRIQVNYIFESTAVKTIMRILEMDVKLLIIDYDFDNVHFDNLFKIVKRIRPRLPIMTICSEPTDEIVELLTNAGANYILRKPVQFEKVIDFIIMVNPS